MRGISSSRGPRLLARAVFAVALAVVTHEAIEPRHEPALMLGVDDIEHGLWAYCLTIAGVAAFPNSRAWLVGAILLALSALAEIVQPFFGRGASYRDWAATAAGVLAALAPMLVLWIRERVLRGRIAGTRSNP